MNPLSTPLIKVSQYDKNSDLKKDNMRITINFKNEPWKLRKIRVFAVVDYHLRSKLKLKMQGLLELFVDTPSGASTILAEGRVALK